jgi:hypothetical protein
VGGAGGSVAHCPRADQQEVHRLDFSGRIGG